MKSVQTAYDRLTPSGHVMMQRQCEITALTLNARYVTHLKIGSQI